jgi:DNA helicase-2/ATP-dependent DNA helicase PcrA
MMLDINTLPNVPDFIDIDSNFRIFAGPGAGKTTWLINHLQHVLKTSKRLHRTRKIACITYTNVAAEEVVNKLSCDKFRFDISTIHSFLYRNIIKPFSYLIAEDEGGEALFNVDKLAGHSEHIPHSDRIRRWQTTIEKLNNKSYRYLQFAQNKPHLLEQLGSLDYSFINNEIDLIFRKQRGVAVPTKNGELWLYKKKYWLDGILHHEDVLYFSYLIIIKSKRVLEFIRNRYPYILIDEFQDTTELQTWIIKKIAESNTKVGVIGDLAQSIYKFAWAKRTDFETFNLEGISSYKLENNHRSTSRIIDFLNCLRSDICQKGNEFTIDGCNVKILIGTIHDAIKWLNDNDFKSTYILTRKNISVEEIKAKIGTQTDNLLKQLYGLDSNSARVKILHSILMGFKFSQKGYLKDAIKEVLRALKSPADKSILKLQLRGTAIEIIDKLKTDETQQLSLYSYYSELSDNIKKKFNFQIGAKITPKLAAKSFYEKTKVSDLLKFIKVDTKSEDNIRTIHSAKGTQFDHVLVHFDELIDFEKYVFEANTCLEADEDDARIYYVGFSRAIRSLFVNIPETKKCTIQKLIDMNVDCEIIMDTENPDTLI